MGALEDTKESVRGIVAALGGAIAFPVVLGGAVVGAGVYGVYSLGKWVQRKDGSVTK